MSKYRIICKACNLVHGKTENPVPENLGAKCSACGMERIAVEPCVDAIESERVFDLFITNKKTGLSKHTGYRISIEDLQGKNDEEVMNLFVQRSAKALGELLRSEAMTMLLDNGGQRR